MAHCMRRKVSINEILVNPCTTAVDLLFHAKKMITIWKLHKSSRENTNECKSLDENSIPCVFENLFVASYQ